MKRIPEDDARIMQIDISSKDKKSKKKIFLFFFQALAEEYEWL